jgi:hypothetical protein
MYGVHRAGSASLAALASGMAVAFEADPAAAEICYCP